MCVYIYSVCVICNNIHRTLLALIDTWDFYSYWKEIFSALYKFQYPSSAIWANLGKVVLMLIIYKLS